MVLRHRDLTIQDADSVAAALEQYRSRPRLGFSDCLILEVARKAGHLPLGTFDWEPSTEIFQSSMELKGYSSIGSLIRSLEPVRGLRCNLKGKAGTIEIWTNSG